MHMRRARRPQLAVGVLCRLKVTLLPPQKQPIRPALLLPYMSEIWPCRMHRLSSRRCSARPQVASYSHWFTRRR